MIWDATLSGRIRDVCEVVLLRDDESRVGDGEMVDEFKNGIGWIGA